MGIMGRKYCLLTMLVILGAFIHVSKAKSQEVHKYKCVALYNHGEEWPVEKLYYYVEFNGNSLTRWQWKDGEWKFGYTTSWGVSTRLIGAVIMVHGDERGIKLPPKVAPIQAVIIPIAQHKDGVLEANEKLKSELENAGIRAYIDDSNQSAGWKFNQWEMKGVPLRLELGPRDIENGQVMAVRRDTHEKISLPLAGIENSVKSLLDKIQQNNFLILSFYL